MMKSIQITVLILLVYCIHIPAQDKTPSSKWRTKDIRIDGIYRDWDTPLRFFDKSTMLTFDIVNDESQLYLFFMSNDPKEISKIVSSGWQIQLSSKEKNKKFSSALSIPPVEFREQEALMGQENKSSASEFKVLISKYKLQLTGINTKGFKTKNGELPLTQSGGINVGISSDSLLNLCYEISIPLKEMIDPGLLSLNESFQINIRIKGIKVPGEDEDKDSGVFSGRQYAGMYGYVYNPGYYYRNPGYEQVSDIFRDDSFKFKFRLTGK